MDYDLSRPVRSLEQTIAQVVAAPGEFFASLPRRDHPRAPVWFAVIVGVLSILLAGAYDIVRVAAGGEGVFGGFGIGLTAVLIVGFVVLAPLFALLGLYIGAAIMHVLVYIIVRDRRETFDASLRIISYSSVTSLVSWIPLVGLLAGLYNFYLQFLGVREMHRAAVWQAVLVAGLPLVVSVSSTLFTVAAATDPMEVARDALLGGGLFGRGGQFSGGADAP